MPPSWSTATKTYVVCALAPASTAVGSRAVGASAGRQIEEVLQEIRMGPRPSIDIDNQFHHVFWFGDLNYRVQLNILDQKERELKAHIAEVKELIAAEQWHALVAADQLQQQMRDGIVRELDLKRLLQCNAVPHRAHVVVPRCFRASPSSLLPFLPRSRWSASQVLSTRCVRSYLPPFIWVSFTR